MFSNAIFTLPAQLQSCIIFKLAEGMRSIVCIKNAIQGLPVNSVPIFPAGSSYASWNNWDRELRVIQTGQVYISCLDTLTLKIVHTIVSNVNDSILCAACSTDGHLLCTGGTICGTIYILFFLKL